MHLAGAIIWSFDIIKLMQSSKVTHRINAKVFELLEKHTEGLRWSDLLSKIKASDPNFHPKTVIVDKCFILV